MGQRWEAWRSPYDVGIIHNLRSVFGPRTIFSMLPYIAGAPEGDGLSFLIAPPPGRLWLPCMAPFCRALSLCIGLCCPPWRICPRTLGRCFPERFAVCATMLLTWCPWKSQADEVKLR